VVGGCPTLPGFGGVGSLNLVLCALSLHIHNMNDDALTERPGCASDGIERHGDISRVEQTIELRSASVKLFGHGTFCFLLFVHGLFELPCQHAPDGRRFGFLANPFFLSP
jgi:hypothetical protein